MFDLICPVIFFAEFSYEFGQNRPDLHKRQSTYFTEKKKKKQIIIKWL